MGKRHKLSIWVIVISLSIVVAIAETSALNESTAQPTSADVVQEERIASEEVKDNDLWTVGVLFRFNHQFKDTLFRDSHFFVPMAPLEQLSAGSEGMESWRYVRMSKKMPGGFKIYAEIGNGRFSSTFVKTEAVLHTIILIEADASPSTTLMVEYEF